MIAVTGANGQLGQLVVDALLKKVPASQIVATVRSAEKGQALEAKGVQVRIADYDRPETLDTAFADVDKLLLISSSEVGRRAPQHKAAIDAAKRAGVKLLAYTSILRADTSPLALAEEHRETEAYLKNSGVPHVLLRNGWYAENYTVSIPTAIQHQAFLGSAGEGPISLATRADYAEAAAAVLTAEEDQAGRVYELAGDQGYTLSDLAAEVSRQTGETIAYKDVPEQAFTEVLVGAGLPDAFAGLLAESDAKASQGALFDDSRQLSALMGRPTATIAQFVTAALKG